MSPSPASEKEPASASPRAVMAAALAWLIPGAGHILLKRRGRGVFFLVLVMLSLAIGCSLHGLLPWQWSGSPLKVLATLGSMGSGAAYFVLRFVVGYQGDIDAPGFEYGKAFIVTAGLMNLLLVLDAWDIALGRKE